MNDFYVYVYLDPRKAGKFIYRDAVFDHEPIYVGKGKKARAYYFDKKNPMLKNKLAKFGKPIVVILAKGLPESEAFKLEVRWIARIGRHDLKKGTLCNKTNGGEGGPSCKGKHPSKETRKKMSEAKKGKRLSEEHKKKIGDGNRGKIVSEETRNKLRKRKQSKETRRKISEAQIGKFIPVETRKRMSEAAKKRLPFSEETRKKLSLSTTKVWKERKKHLKGFSERRKKK